MNNTDYRRINVTGSNNNPTSTNPVADASLNIPFPSLPLYNLHVNYGFDLSGAPDQGLNKYLCPQFHILLYRQYHMNLTI